MLYGTEIIKAGTEPFHSAATPSRWTVAWTQCSVPRNWEAELVCSRVLMTSKGCPMATHASAGAADEARCDINCVCVCVRERERESVRCVHVTFDCGEEHVTSKACLATLCAHASMNLRHGSPAKYPVPTCTL